MSGEFALRPHPAAPAVVRAVRVECCLGATALTLRYVVEGACRWPPARRAARADDLWRHTCCECFVAADGAAAYREFNFSPSGEWAIHDFTDYRRRADDPPIAVPPGLTFTAGADGFVLTAEIDRAHLPPVPWRFGLAAVIEAEAGEVGYWALAHPRPRPDFHDRAGLAGRLPSP